MYNPDVEFITENKYRIYFRGKVFDLYLSPIGPWCLWSKNEKLGEYLSYPRAIISLKQMIFVG